MKKLTIALVAHDNRKRYITLSSCLTTILFVRVRPEIWFVKLSRKKG